MKFVSISVLVKVGAVCVTMFSKDAATVMTFTPYFDGAAPLRIDNDTSFEICYRQLWVKFITTLSVNALVHTLQHFDIAELRVILFA